MHSEAHRSRRLGSYPRLPATLPTAPADEAGGCGPTTRYQAYEIDWIATVAGWSLLVMDDEDGDGFTAPTYIARSAEEDVVLDVSRFNFKPTQDRFEWFVRHGFPRRPTPKGGWFSSEVDTAIACEQREIAA